MYKSTIFSARHTYSKDQRSWMPVFQVLVGYSVENEKNRLQWRWIRSRCFLHTYEFIEKQP